MKSFEACERLLEEEDVIVRKIGYAVRGISTKEMNTVYQETEAGVEEAARELNDATDDRTDVYILQDGEKRRYSE